jgi:uncharacterized protein (TIRG00374 family)
MNDNLKKILSSVLPVVLSLALLWFLSTKIDFVKAGEDIRAADIGYLICAFVIYLLINLILLVRWFIFIKALNLKVSFLSVMRYFLIGILGNSLLPSAVGGDVIKLLGLCRGSNEKPKIVASALIDRLSGFAGMVVVATLSFIFGFRYISNPSVVILIAVMAGASLFLGTILFNETAYSFCSQIFSRLPKFKNSLMRMHYDIAHLKGRQDTIYQAIALSALSQITLAFVFFLVSKALHQNVAFFYFLIFTPLICVVATVPSIGGLGVREAGSAYFFGKVGLSVAQASSVTFIPYLFMVLVGLLGGLFYLITKPKGDAI